MLNYFEIIHKYIPVNSSAYRIYTIHVTMVTNLALKIARRLELDQEQRNFMQEACMLHDIGIVKTYSPEIGCHGHLPYIQHIVEGRKILLKEGLPRHARIAANHIGVGGISKEEIIAQNMDLPHEDFLCDSIEEQIISYADLFYSKNSRKLFTKKKISAVREKIKDRPLQRDRFEKWYKEFGV